MSYDFDAFLEENSNSLELFTSEVGAIEVVPVEKARDLFPNVVLSESPHLSYFPYKLCHSLPKVNLRQRCFTGKVLQNSFASAVDQLLNIDHMILDNGISTEDKICGHIKAVRVGLGKELASEMAICPIEPIPVIALGCLFNRAKGIKSIIENHNKGKEQWKVSMECDHDWRDAYLRYDGKYIPIKDADPGMLQCIKRDRVLPFKDRELAVCLGGLEGNVTFWGAGLTKTPADKDAAIMHFIAAGSREVASRTKHFYMPFQMFENVPDFEIASKIEEMASISVLGETDPSEDGHTHMVLSDMTIMPTTGHDHMVKTMQVKTGTKPEITGITCTHCDRMMSSDGSGMMQESVSVHAHTFSLNLKGKKAPAETDSGDGLPEMDSASLEDIMTLKEMLKQLNESIASLGKATTDADRNRVLGEIADVQKDILTLENQTSVQERVEAEVKTKLEAGTLLRKEDVDKLVADKVAEATKAIKDEADAKALEVQKRTERAQKLIEAGISAKYELEGLTDAEGKPMTIESYLPTLPVDASGDTQFTINLNAWKQARDLQAEKEKKDAEAQQQALNGKAADAASAANKPKPSIVLTPGGAPAGDANGSHGKEVATAPTKAGGASFDKKALAGKYR